MEAPKPIKSQEIFININKNLKSEQGKEFSLQITFKNNKFIIIVQKKGKIFSDTYKNEYTIQQIQENNYFKMFSTAEEILEEIKERIDSKVPILNECNNNIINLVIFLPTTKYKKIEFNLTKDKPLNENNDDLKLIIEQLYEKVDELTKENKEIKSKLEIIENEIKKKKDNVILKKNNFHWINREVNIVNSSEFVKDFDGNIMLGKSNKNKYSCTKGNRNHFIEFSFIRNYFLKSIRILVYQAECSLKTFKVEIISENGITDNIGEFIRSKYQDKPDFEEFEINRECQGLKLYLIDNWGKQGGNYILISKIDFNVSD